MGSTRLPGKPLADIGGTPMVVHTWRAAAQHPAIDSACVATDHTEIADAVREAGGEVILTASSHSTGTDRCLEAWKKWGRQGAVINLQGDEPFPEPTHISAICTALKSGLTDVVSAMRPAIGEEAKRPERVKVATNEAHRALYFSRSPIPHGGPHFVHLGIYGFAPNMLAHCAALPVGRLETLEKLEQLRWVEAGVTIGMVSVNCESGPGSVDTLADLERVRKWHAQQPKST